MKNPFIFGVLLLLSSSVYSSTQKPQIDIKVTGGDAPIEFEPFGYDLLINPATGRPYEPGELVKIEVDGKLLFQGIGRELLDFINSLEAYLNKYGKTLRRGDINIIEAIARDPELLKLQVLNELKLSADAIIHKVKDAIQECSFFNISHLGINIKTGIPFDPEDLVEVENGLSLEVRDLVERLNDQQQMLCAMGRSMIEEIGDLEELFQSGQDGLDRILKARDSLMSDLGISRFNEYFNMSTLSKVKDYAEIAIEIADWIDKKEVPSAEQVLQLRDKVNTVLPEELRIPDIPNIPAPIMPRRLDLKLKKRKDWKGFDFGDRKIFNAHAKAFYEIRGSEQEVEATAEGKAGLYVVNKEINILYAGAQLYAGSSEVRGTLELRFIGKQIFKRDGKHEYSWNLADKQVGEKSYKEGYSEVFPVLGIPVTVEMGAEGKVILGLEAGLKLLGVNGSVIPSAMASGFVGGAVGVKSLRAGAEIQILILELKPHLKGSGNILLSDNGPKLKLSLDSYADVFAVSGKGFAYVEFPYPKFRPPFKISWGSARKSMKLFDWSGNRIQHKIMDWWIEMTPYTSISGGALLDQDDREEAKALQEATQLAEAVSNVHQRELRLQEKEYIFFTEIKRDLESQANQAMPQEAGHLEDLKLSMDSFRDTYIQSLNRLNPEP